MIEVNGLTKYYGQMAAIHDVSFEVSQGEIIGFLGPNGAGKTTTMRILTGFSPASSGTARIAGFDIANHSIEVKRRIGYLPESVPLYHEMIVSKFLKYVGAIKGIEKSRLSSEIGRVVERCGLEAVSQRVIGNLSKGYRQRVGLAQALVGNPPVLILDEPTVGLDPKQIVEIRQVIKDLAREHTVLLSTHILPEVTMICERVIIIHHGRIVAQDTMSNLTGVSENTDLDLEISGNSPDIIKTLEGVHGIISVKKRGLMSYDVVAKGSSTVAETISKAIVDGGFGIKSMRTKSRTLEDIFLDVISSEDGWAPSGNAEEGGIQ